MDTLRLDVGPEEGVSPLGRPSKYTEEFRRDAVELVRSSGRPINEVARELGLSHETLRNWVRRQEQSVPPQGVVAGAGLSVADKDAEIARLRAEVAELRVEKEILRKADRQGLQALT